MTTPKSKHKGGTPLKDDSKPTEKKARPAPQRAAGAPPHTTITPKPASKKAATTKATRLRKGNGTSRPGSKTAKILELLKRPGGATLKELMKAKAIFIMALEKT